MEQIVVYADDADLEIAEVAAQFGDAAFEGKAENEQPIAVALVAAGFDGFGDGLFADGAELGADVQIGFRFRQFSLFPLGQRRESKILRPVAPMFRPASGKKWLFLYRASLTC